MKHASIYSKESRYSKARRLSKAGNGAKSTISRRSIRLKGYDYSAPGKYFVTIHTGDRVPIFGNVIDGVMQLSPLGQIVEAEWQITENLRPYVRLDAHIVMPNHFHGIIIIEKRHNLCREEPTILNQSPGTTAASPDIDRSTTQALSKFGAPVAGSLATIVGAFKSAATRKINKSRGTRGASVWQRGYYERIIRGEKALHRVRAYINNNPMKWWWKYR